MDQKIVDPKTGNVTGSRPTQQTTQPDEGWLHHGISIIINHIPPISHMQQKTMEATPDSNAARPAPRKGINTDTDTKRADNMTDKNTDYNGKWIGKMHMKKGALHKEMGVPEGQKIPAGKLASAASKGGTLGKRARLAETLKGFKK